jgi:hypothetical protein
MARSRSVRQVQWQVLDGDLSVDNSGNHQIVPGIVVTSSGQATVDPSLADVLFDLAIKLEEPTSLPVDGVTEFLRACKVLIDHGGVVHVFSILNGVMLRLVNSLISPFYRLRRKTHDGLLTVRQGTRTRRH